MPVFTVPLLVTQFSLRRYAAIRATSLQTIRALSRVTEVGGYVEPGHSRRVSTIAVALGRELALNEADLLDLEYAALMHDIGQLSFSDPIPGGATLVVAPAERRRIAELGAEIIRTTGTLERVAEIVEGQVPRVQSAIARTILGRRDAHGPRLGARSRRQERAPPIASSSTTRALRRW